MDIDSCRTMTLSTHPDVQNNFSRTMELTGGGRPPESPDANPIENLWHELKIRKVIVYIGSRIEWKKEQVVWLCVLVTDTILFLQEYLRREIKQRTKDELVQGILSFWSTVDAEECRRYISHLKKVIFRIIELNGDTTGYQIRVQINQQDCPN